MVNRPGLDFSFSGLKTAVKNTIAELSIGDELDSQARANIAGALKMQWYRLWQ